jgi:hypothetical protein
VCRDDAKGEKDEDIADVSRGVQDGSICCIVIRERVDDRAGEKMVVERK